MKTIFVEDSNEDLLYILTAVLQEASYKVYAFEACNNMFFNMVSIHRPDLILLDFKLSGLDCISAVKQLKSSFKDIPVIAISTNHTIVDQYIKIGFNDYLLKPFELNTLYTTVTRNLQVIN